MLAFCRTCLPCRCWIYLARASMARSATWEACIPCDPWAWPEQTSAEIWGLPSSVVPASIFWTFRARRCMGILGSCRSYRKNCARSVFRSWLKNHVILILTLVLSCYHYCSYYRQIEGGYYAHPAFIGSRANRKTPKPLTIVGILTWFKVIIFLN